ncbi:MAG: AgmX/PglI C-terminal domain-containing protein [Labilithrix sp.]|nr:AgmX/PglI C-terminal domain-containing protein [Labilithrix sp.]
MTKVKAVPLLATTLTLALACGGNPPEPATPAPADAPPAVAPSAPVDAEPDASAATGETSPAAPPDAETPAPAPAPAPAIIGETKDECTPVGVDFEKRARPKLKECYAEGKKKSPTLEGTVKIKITVDVKGKIKSTKVIEKTLPDPVADCMLKAVKATPFPEVEKCWDSTLTIPVTFPTPK